jgi:hypothetical protein
MSEFKTFRTYQSPFHKERNLQDKTTSVSFRLPTEAYNDLMDYFNNIFDSNAKTNGFKKISLNALDMICSERKTYNNLECFMLIPKTDDIGELYDSEIIVFINDDIDFENDFNLVSKFNDDYNLVYSLYDFTEENVPFGIFTNVRESCLYRLRKDFALESWYSFTSALGTLYKDLNLDDCYIVRFPLNNYLDVFRDGQYQNETYKDDHIGAYVFEDISSKRKIYCKIVWNYTHEMNLISFDLIFEPESEFINDIYKMNDKRLNEAINDVITDKHRIDVLLEIRKNIEDELSFVDEILKNEYPDEYQKLK